MPTDFWRNSRVAVIGGGSWGTVLAQLISENCNDVRIWTREEDRARSINSQRVNPDYVSDMQLSPHVKAYVDLDRVLEGGVDGVIWALPSKATREEARKFAPRLKGTEILWHATKGIEERTLKRMTEVLREELPLRRLGVISGPNLATEIARGEPAATVVASDFQEVIRAGHALLNTPRFRVYSSMDVVGIEWAGTLKNILAIASGALDAMGLGWNARSMLISRGLAEMVRFGVAMGGQESTFLGLAGVGDLLATCSSPLSRNYRVGAGLAKGTRLSEVLEGLGSTAEGVQTARIVADHARERNIYMPITQAVNTLLQGQVSVQQLMQGLMARPPMPDRAIGEI
jgi:glycerol-3-phosphate dehydrogenase (NAD(P)+)